MNKLNSWTALALCAGVAGCSAEMQRPPQQGGLVAAQIGSIERLHALGDVYLASQPSPADLTAARAHGVVSVVNLRLPGELEFDEGTVVTDLGMRYHNPAFNSPETLSDATLDDTRALLSAATEKPMLMHCASANRVGAVWLAHRVLDDGVDLDTALDEAHQVGLRSAPLEQRVREYISSRSTAQ